MDIRFDKLFRYDRIMEHCNIAIPVKQGELFSTDGVEIFQNGFALPIQKKVTSRHKDNSIRYMFLRFMADIPGNKKMTLDCVLNNDSQVKRIEYTPIKIEKSNAGIEIDTGKVSFKTVNNSMNLFEYVNDGNETYKAEQFVGPILKAGNKEYSTSFGQWRVKEEGPLYVAIVNQGKCVSPDASDKNIEFETTITAYADKPWIEVGVRLINTTDDKLWVQSFVFAVKTSSDAQYNPVLVIEDNGSKADSTGCGDIPTDNRDNYGPVFTTSGIKELPFIEERIQDSPIRTCVANSNYKTTFTIASDGSAVSRVVDADFLISEANEHFAEVMYGTFFADFTTKKGGVCATIFQAQQNFPKACKADESGIYLMLVPEEVNKVTMASGMSREQKFLLHFHSPEEKIVEIDNRSLIYQMPDKPHLDPTVFKEAEIMPDLFVDKDKINQDVEIVLVGKADGHGRCYGMMNWGDVPDPGYTTQGRGKGRPVWTNNEYDFPHAMYLMFARTGTRRFLDYANVASSHWMDVDVCHYSSNPLHLGGQWEHTMGHCDAGSMVCSHEWVEGLIDYYHFTGDERGIETAIGIGNNVLRLLDTPMYQHSGEANARETGWALRTLVALYAETWDEKWITKCQWIIGHFREWGDEYGEWIAPYTDNTMVRVGFMISVAVGSLMRYYRVFKDEEVKKMILKAVDDLVENCYMDNGLFYYKELPSLDRNGNNTLLLEAMTIAYELTGDSTYLTYGKKTLEKYCSGPEPGIGGAKRHVEDAVISGNGATKGFAQSFIPVATYYKAMTDCGLL